MNRDTTFGESEAEKIDFAHRSERDFARLLEFYDVPWEYEPHRFAIEWDARGRATRFFRPDFYLPEEDLYIEITTMNQKLVTKKNRKIKQLREFYPQVRCKIFYQRDYLHLLVKYGLDDPDGDDRGAAPTRIPGPPDVTNLADKGEASVG